MCIRDRLSLLLTACKGEKSTPDTGELQLELSMPAMFSGQEISKNLGYFWQQDDVVTLEIRSGGKSITLHSLRRPVSYTHLPSISDRLAMLPKASPLSMASFS